MLRQRRTGSRRHGLHSPLGEKRNLPRRFAAALPVRLRTAVRRSAKLVWWSITGQLLNRLAERRARSPRRPDRPTFAQSLQRRFRELEPLRTYPTPSAGRYLSIITDSINTSSLFGGVGTAIILGTLLAERLGADLRLITRLERADPGRLTKLLTAHGLTWSRDMDFVYAPAETGDEVPVRDTELFLTTSWWTTYSARQSIDPDRIIYLVQEDERTFYPYGDDRLRCAETLGDPDLRFVVNSELLFRHLTQGAEALQNICRRGLWFEPAFPDMLYHRERRFENLNGSRNFFFYARPNHLRNLYWRGVEAIAAAIEDGVLCCEAWRFLFVGREIERISLPRGVTPEIIQNLSWSEYAALVRQIDLGVSLMASPHPSYPPLDLAASGAVVVTNRWGLKESLKEYSENILCVEPTVASLKRGIETAVSIALDEKVRSANYARNGMLRDWREALAPVLQAYGEWRFMNRRR